MTCRIFSAVSLSSSGMFFLATLATAQTCPCWTAEQLESIRSNTVIADYCMNELDLNDGLALTCTAINVEPDDCGVGYPQFGWVQAWNGTIESVEDFVGPGCYMADPVQDIMIALCQSENCDGPITPEEALACAEEIAALGETFAAKSCSIDDRPCIFSSDCPGIGECAIDGSVCVSNSDCDGIQACVGMQFQICVPGNPIDQCFPAGCQLEWSDDKSELAFTKQAFSLSMGLVSDVSEFGDFVGAQCLGPFARSAEDLPFDPASGDARYYLGSATAGVSCVGHGESSLDPDPRDDLDAVCP